MQRCYCLRKLLKIALLLIVEFCGLPNAELPKNADTSAMPALPDTVKNSERERPRIKMTLKNPGTAALLSAAIPGAGQLYTKNYVKSGMFVAGEGIFGFIAYYRYQLLKDYQNTSADLFNQFMRYTKKDSVYKVQKRASSAAADSTVFDTTFMSMHVRLNYNYAEFQEKENRVLFQQSALWMASLYYWNILDALKNTGYFRNDNPKNPGTAGWLSAIPFLGLGQFYNGELSKAGMLFTAQVSIGFMVYNYASLVSIAEDNIRMLSTPGTRQSSDPDATDLLTKWNSKRQENFRNRNMFLWYSIVLYIYGMLDAVVDAHLHDAAAKMRLEPDLQPDQIKAGLNLKVDF